MLIFSGLSNKPLAERISEKLNTKLSELEIHVFPDGEKRVRVAQKVVGEKVVVVQPTSTPADQNYMELFFIVDALKRSGASEITAVVPYLGYERQDHVFRDGEAVSLEVITQTLQRVGVNKLIAFDLHSVKVPELFTIPVLHLSALDLFAEKIKTNYTLDANKLNAVLVSPDMGGIRRIKLLSEKLDKHLPAGRQVPYATIEKNRDLITGEIGDSSLEGDVKGKTAIIVDDIISTGRTIIAAEEILLKNGAGKMFVFATHAVFSGNAAELLKSSKAEKIYVTDTIFIPKEKQFDKLEVLPIAKIIADNLR